MPGNIEVLKICFRPQSYVENYLEGRKGWTPKLQGSKYNFFSEKQHNAENMCANFKIYIFTIKVINKVIQFLISISEIKHFRTHIFFNLFSYFKKFQRLIKFGPCIYVGIIIRCNSLLIVTYFTFFHTQLHQFFRKQMLSLNGRV